MITVRGTTLCDVFAPSVVADLGFTKLFFAPCRSRVIATAQTAVGSDHAIDIAAHHVPAEHS